MRDDLITRYKVDVNLKLESRSQGDDKQSNCDILYIFVSVFPIVFI